MPLGRKLGDWGILLGSFATGEFRPKSRGINPPLPFIPLSPLTSAAATQHFVSFYFVSSPPANTSPPPPPPPKLIQMFWKFPLQPGYTGPRRDIKDPL